MNYQLPTAHAIVNPLASPNNKFGIHIIGANSDEASPAATLVNSTGGDWGYVTVLVESKNRDQKAWQKFFDDLRRRHLIPIVRLATEPQGDSWKLPYEGEEDAWAQFLDSLIWPIKNRYVVIYNEPNHALEWGGKVDPKSYARALNKTIDALKRKNPDFFVLNAGLDASTPSLPPKYEDEAIFLRKMNEEVPGIFEKLDGWASHSYPNPNFSGSPTDYGKGTVWTWEWEMEFLEELGVKKRLPIFVTETGWKHAEGINYDRSLLKAETVGHHYKQGFLDCWNNPNIVAVTPFLLNYQEPPFDHFSFKKVTGEAQKQKILGVSYPDSDYYPVYYDILNLSKVPGRPYQEQKAQFLHGSVYSTIVMGETYEIPLTFKNTGQSIWNEYEPLQLRAVEGGQELGVLPVRISSKIEPGNDVVATLKLSSQTPGLHKLGLQLFAGNEPFDKNIYQFKVDVKSPATLLVSAKLPWKNNFSGEYILKIASEIMTSTMKVILDQGGSSAPLDDSRYLLPDYSFDFTLYKPFYKPKTIGVKIKSGPNNLDFGTLEQDFFSALFHPKELWKLLGG